VLEAFRQHLGTDVGGVSPEGAVRLDVTQCGGTSEGSAYVEVDGEPLPRSSAEDAATIAAALRANVPAGEVA
jgi:NADH:ubiquinone oxidoreductase subunit E